MHIMSLEIKNFKSISDMTINDIENALILVGKNNTGKSAALSAIKLISGDYTVTPYDYNRNGKNIQIKVTLFLTLDDLRQLHLQGKISHYRNFDRWFIEFQKRIPCYREGLVQIICRVTPEGQKIYTDGLQKKNPYIHELIPSVFSVDEDRQAKQLNDFFFKLQGFKDLDDARAGLCVFDASRHCNDCFDCIPVLNKKTPETLSLYESMILVKHKLYSSNVKAYQDQINTYFQKNFGSQYAIQYRFDFDAQQLLKQSVFAKNLDNQNELPLDEASTSLRSLYIFSLLQAYLDTTSTVGSIILVDEPEMHLHPELQRITSEILYKLSKKNQVIFTTHSPTMLFNFSDHQIRQVVLDEGHNTILMPHTRMDVILDDLGYSAIDLLNVSFVFIVEGKDDHNRLPLLLERYYHDVRDHKGELKRIAIITTNSCTNIKTYANLKYMNQAYLKDNFLMIRDSDGKDPSYLKEQLCHYYERRAYEDDAKLPRITPRNVLVLKYYAFENYFLDPQLMVKVGVIESVDGFYKTLFDRYQSYLKNSKSGKNFQMQTGLTINSPVQLRKHIEPFKIYMRGHNLFDIFYGKYKTREAEIQVLKQYIGLAPRETFLDILDAIDAFVYFDSRKQSPKGSSHE